ncbi:MAG: hemolysin secretion protein [Caulobacter sp.]|nr:hemolysin secretion protein [Caulobacter sp.]
MFRFLRRPTFWVITVIILVLAGGFVVMKGAAKAKKAHEAAVAKAAPPSPYAAVANGKSDVEGGIINVAARRGGIISQVLVQEGDNVVKGQVLARQEDDDARLTVIRSRAEVAQARSAIAATEVQLVTARREYARYKALAATNNVAAQKLDTARDAIDAAQAGLEAQRAAVTTATARLREAEYNLDLTVIRAPADGRIIRRYANPGAGASTLNVTALFDLEPNTQRIVRAEIPESAVPVVTEGQAVELTPEADPTKVFVGKVIRRAAVFGARRLQSDDPSERTDERVVEVVVSADGAPFLIGQRVLVKFMKPGSVAGAARPAPKAVAPPK